MATPCTRFIPEATHAHWQSFVTVDTTWYWPHVSTASFLLCIAGEMPIADNAVSPEPTFDTSSSALAVTPAARAVFGCTQS